MSNEIKKTENLEILGIEELESRMEMAMIVAVNGVEPTVNNKCNINNVAGCGVK
ncbi:MAG: hypothetical protein H6510_02695 [Acidobacteria bacterium]|nr:hypothetical protein [Acidobacteriota bacterium]MCB9396704.1 hypothetical protein [Acidobacteriota bacterium]